VGEWCVCGIGDLGRWNLKRRWKQATRTKKNHLPLVGAWVFGVVVGIVLLPLFKSLSSK
jgi:hypothetical protein